MGKGKEVVVSPRVGVEEGIKTFVKLQGNIHTLYPFLTEDLTENSACLVDVRQKDQPIVHVNDIFLQLTLYPREEIVGRNCRFLQGKYTNRETVRKIRNAVAQGVGLDVELVNYRRDGMPFWNNFLLLPVWENLNNKEKGKPPTHYVAIQKDVTFIKPNLSDPVTWCPETLAVFCDSCGLSKLADFVFDSNIDGCDFLDISQDKFAVIGLPSKELEQAHNLQHFLKESPEDVSSFLTACRFSQNDKAQMFNELSESRLERQQRLQRQKQQREQSERAFQSLQPTLSRGKSQQEMTRNISLSSCNTAFSTSTTVLGKHKKVKGESKKGRKMRGVTVSAGEIKRKRSATISGKREKGIVGAKERDDLVVLPTDVEGEQLSFLGVKGSQIESVVIKVYIMFGGKQTEKKLRETSGFVILLNLSRGFGYQDLKFAIQQSTKFKNIEKYALYFQKDTLEEDLLVDSSTSFELAQEHSNRWRDEFSFMMMIPKLSKFKKLKAKQGEQFVDDDSANSISDEISRASQEPDLVPGVLSNPAYTVHLIERAHLDPGRAEIFDLIIKYYTCHNKHKTKSLLDNCLDRCIAQTNMEEGATLFRSEQGCLSFLINYCDVVAGQWRSDFLVPIIHGYLKEEQTPDLVKQYVGKLIISLIQNIEDLPLGYHQLLTNATTKMGELPCKFKHYPITTFLFLRFLCPALVVPSKYEVAVGEAGKDREEKKRLVALGAMLQQVVSKFTARDSNQFSFELGILYSKIVNRFAINLEIKEIQQKLKQMVSHHELVTTTSNFEKAQDEEEKRREKMKRCKSPISPSPSPTPSSLSSSSPPFTSFHVKSDSAYTFSSSLAESQEFFFLKEEK